MHSDSAELLESLLQALWETLPESVKSYADARWPRGTHRGRRWLESQVMVIPSLRLMYVPIAKNGCSTFKRLMLNLAGYPDESPVNAHVHACLDFYETGLQLKDWPCSDVARFMSEPGWLRFTVVRDPLERLASAYLEKFVRNRMEPGNRIHTRAVVEAVQGGDEPDFQTGITFREFTRYVATTPPERLDPHWRPQALCLPSRCEGLRRFSLNDLTPLTAQLDHWCGFAGPIGHDNTAVAEGAIETRGMAADSLPAVLNTAGLVSPYGLVDEAIREGLAVYVAEDQSRAHGFISDVHAGVTLS